MGCSLRKATFVVQCEILPSFVWRFHESVALDDEVGG